MEMDENQTDGKRQGGILFADMTVQYLRNQISHMVESFFVKADRDCLVQNSTYRPSYPCRITINLGTLKDCSLYYRLIFLHQKVVFVTGTSSKMASTLSKSSKF